MLIAKSTPQIFVHLELKTVTAHRLVSYALLSLLFLTVQKTVQNAHHAYLESS